MKEVVKKNKSRDRRIMFMDLMQSINEKYDYEIMAQVEFGYSGDVFRIHRSNDDGGISYVFSSSKYSESYEEDGLIVTADPNLEKAEIFANKVLMEGLK